jgi:hypothetical protein
MRREVMEGKMKDGSERREIKGSDGLEGKDGI